MISQKCFLLPFMFIDGCLNHHVGFHFTVFLTIFKIKSHDFVQKEACVVLVTEGLIFPLTNWASMN